MTIYILKHLTNCNLQMVKV